ncbi:high-potential iron-sulfur protein [Haloarcula sp. 1CSR25-25]|uniref:high-potential iron-sulfur protein n=1 Tax=Haloarcula sp. 1CSR25-25 TaxID=2862545 RepID=UPI00289392B2|nr:high-potential iron-sulfur protein [Haloarcula sp. 1CSR25-25]MDT3435091.1 high-potential iron-sulfur protein [Haloarcula sp. 1CSR25-25]
MQQSKSWGDSASNYDVWSRRNYLVATVGLAALSGCVGDTGDGGEATEPGEREDDDEDEDDDGEEDEELPEGVTAEEFERGPVPDVYLSATSLGNEQRNPDALHTKAEVSFSEYDEARENEAHTPGACCANCADYIPDMNGDRFGACAEVEGYIDGADWCTIYEALPEPDVPEGMSEAELATAEVPEEYRTASSQVGESRDPEDLFSHEEVNLMESVDAIEEGIAPPGQSCGNCAEFIPDKNGDTWGACAKVEGFIAVEDWCAVWEHVSEEL